MQTHATMKGFTLIELLIGLAITGILVAVAIPIYNGYMTSSRENVARTNLQTLRLAEDAFFFDNNTYKDGIYDPAGAVDTLDTTTLGWKPNQDGKNFTYTVTAGACGTITKCFKITVTGFNNTVSVSE